MKLYNLTYDCNSPVVQQVNVPTNSDYKVGIKVKRNGEIQNLSPESVTLGTLSADAKKTNGYVTFTRSAGDEASYTNEKLDVQTNVEINKKFELYHNTSGTSTSSPPLSCLASEIGLTGKAIKPEDIYVYYRNNVVTAPTEAELALSAVTYWGLTFQEGREFIGLTNCALISGDQGTIWSFRSQDAGFRKQWLLEQGMWDGETPFFFFAVPGATEFTMRYDYTFDGSEIIRFADRSCNNNNYNAGYFKSVTGEAFSAKFDLNTNIFKSQQGDIGELGKRANTVNIAGTLADNTPFDFNAVIK